MDQVASITVIAILCMVVVIDNVHRNGINTDSRALAGAAVLILGLAILWIARYRHRS